ncbi:MAG TPA: thioredoxin-disulfide reductase [Solirubrobacteraceae bacterium]|jgi:thioredoxin reductase (NADPH)|nr:thioredoxin-disulfide reductase [Solirubrobacteraceae bacterium]
MSDLENVIIIGSGPAGYTAALYTARANLNPLVIEGFAWGGLLQQTTDVENYPGFPDGIMGPEMMQRFREQAERFGAKLVTDQADRVALASEPGGIHSVWVGDTEYRSRTVVLAMGAEHRKLGVTGEEELAGRGVSYCATCDAAFFRGAPTMIVGGGDSAMEEAIFLSKFASKVVVVHRRDEFRASKIMLERARAQANIEFMVPYTVKEFVAGETGPLAHAVLVNTDTGEEHELIVSGTFIAIGHEPQSELVAGQIDLDDGGYVLTEGKSTRTNRPGVFAAGDLVDHTYRQAVTAAGSGTQAALDAEWYLRDTPGIPPPKGMPIGDPAAAQWAPEADPAVADPAPRA